MASSDRSLNVLRNFQTILNTGRLGKTGYVKREPNPADRRSCIVHLIPQRLGKFGDAYQSKADLLAGVLSQFSDRDLGVLLRSYEQLNRDG